MEENKINLWAILGVCLILMVGIGIYHRTQVEKLESENAKLKDMHLNSGKFYISGDCVNGSLNMYVNNQSITDPNLPSRAYGRWLQVIMTPENRSMQLGQGYAAYDAEGADWVRSQAMEEQNETG